MPYSPKKAGFTLLELLIAVAIISLIASYVISSVRKAKEAAYFVVAKKELRSVVDALALYKNENRGLYPADASRNIPPGLEKFLAPGQWPEAPWPGSVYDWENWPPNQLSYDPKEQVYQISIRFCPIGGPLSACKFPDEEWAKNFDVQSAMYYCIEGPCRSHASKPPDHPGYCVNCQ